MIQKLSRIIEQKHGKDFGEVFRGAVVALIVKILAAGGGLLFNYGLARMFGAAGTGAYYSTLSVITLAVVFGRFGLDLSAMRLIAPAYEKKEYDTLRALFSSSFYYILFISSLCFLIVEICAPYIAQYIFENEDLSTAIRVMGFSIVPMSLLFLYSEALRAIKKIKESQLFNFALGPFFNLLVLVILYFFFTGPQVIIASYSYVVAVVICFLIGIYFWKYRLFKPSRKLINPESSLNRDLIETACPFWGIMIVNYISDWSAITILAFLETENEVGIYALALRTALLTSFFFRSVGIVIAPRFSVLAGQKRLKELEQLGKKSTRLMLLMSLPVLLIFFVFPEQIMGIYGEEFRSGATYLAIIALGQFIHLGTGNVGHVLMMTGYGKSARNNNFIGMCVNLLLMLILVPLMGVIGAAIAMTTAILVQKTLALYMVRKYLGISLL